MFNVKIKVKEGNNTLPRSGQRSNGNTLGGSGRNSPATGSLRSSLASSNNGSLRRKDKRVRIVTSYDPVDRDYERHRQQQFGKDLCIVRTTLNCNQLLILVCFFFLNR